MPGGLNGRELADRVVELCPEIKVLFTSGCTEQAIIHQGQLDPGVQLLSKPYRRQHSGRIEHVALFSVGSRANVVEQTNLGKRMRQRCQSLDWRGIDESTTATQWA